jgi:rubrerythrin
MFSWKEVVNMAVKVEDSGSRIYLMASKRVNSRLRSLFEMLAKEEIRHRKIFEQFGKNLEKGDFTFNQLPTIPYSGEIVQSSLFSEKSPIMKAIASADIAEILNHCIDFEIMTYNFYKALLDSSTGGAIKIINKIMNEEKKHEMMLREALDELKKD